MKDKSPNIRILTVRDQKVVLDSDLAAVYGVTTKRLNEQLRRNRRRFPEDFAFQLTAEEFEALRSQFATLDEGGSSRELMRSQSATTSGRLQSMRSQFATASRRNIRYRPWAFTEHGALQVANVLQSDRAIAMSVGACPERSRTGNSRVYRTAGKAGRECGAIEEAGGDR
jgi:hypothetical protein